MQGEPSKTRLARTNRLPVLLGALVGFLVFSPIAQLAGLGRTSLTIAFLVVLVAAINAVHDRLSWKVFTMVFGVASLFFWLLRLIVDTPLVNVGADLSGTCLLALTTLVVFRRIMIADASEFDTLCGAAAVYLLIGMTWAISFKLIEGLSPGAFGGLVEEPVERWNQLMYFSLTTLTTLGYGDISPINPFARLWSTLEAIAGVFYLTILVARLVAMFRHRRKVDRL